MAQLILEGILGFLIEGIVTVFWWLILFPVVWLASLPFILVIAIFRRGKYSYLVSSMLYSVHSFWRDSGFFVAS